LKIPGTVGVPLMVIVLGAQCAETPVGKPLAPDMPSFDMPVARVVECVTALNTVLIHDVGDEDAAPTVLARVTVILPVALTLPQPPVSGML
jgi:hypothetical protein